MEEKGKSYSNNEITVFWKPSLCIYSAICTNGLPNVFNPNSRPWININGAPNDDIIDIVNKCPSGALTFSYKNEKPYQKEINNNSEIKVNILKDGPIIIKADCKIIDYNGKTYHKKGSCSICVCSLSREKPFCDGSHYKNKKK